MTRPPKAPRPPSSHPAPSPTEGGIVGKVRGLKKLRKAPETRRDPRRATVDKIRNFMGQNKPVREAPEPVERRVYDDEDESEN